MISNVVKVEAVSQTFSAADKADGSSNGLLTKDEAIAAGFLFQDLDSDGFISKAEVQDLVSKSGDKNTQFVLQASQARLDSNQTQLDRTDRKRRGAEAQLDSGSNDGDSKASRQALDEAHAAQEKAQKAQSRAQDTMDRAWSEDSVKGASEAVSASHKAVKSYRSATAEFEESIGVDESSAASPKKSKGHEKKEASESDASSESKSQTDRDPDRKPEKPISSGARMNPTRKKRAHRIASTSRMDRLPSMRTRFSPPARQQVLIQKSSPPKCGMNHEVT